MNVISHKSNTEDKKKSLKPVTTQNIMNGCVFLIEKISQRKVITTRNLTVG